jgi:uncharacterized protein YodC (DUF2158 family)
MEIGDVVRMKCGGGDPMVVVAVKDGTATCRWPHPSGLEPLKAKLPVAALELTSPKMDVCGAWEEALKATGELFRGELR